MDHPQVSTSAFRGRRTSRKTHWTVHWMDRLAQWAITVGGMGTILTVFTVCLFLFWVVLPLFESPTIKKTGEFTPPPEILSGSVIQVGMDEYQILGWVLSSGGNLTVFRADNGTIVEQRSLALDRTITAVSLASTGDSGLLGFNDGRIQVGRFGITTDYVESDALPESIRNSKVGEIADWENGVVVHTTDGQFRLHRFDVELREPMQIAQTSICLIDHAIRSNGLIFCALSDDNTLTIDSLSEQKNLLTGKIKYKPESAIVPFTPPPGKGKPHSLKITGLGDNVFVIWEDGYAMRFNTQTMKQPFLAEELNLLGDGAQVTALQFLIGRNTLFVGDNAGRVRGWFRTRADDAKTPDGVKLVMAHEMVKANCAVASLSASQRSRVIAAGYADGWMRLFQATSNALMIEVPTPGKQPITALAIASKDDGLFAITPKEFLRYFSDFKYPEATLAATFKPVWYEGFPKPAHIWQSSSGTDDFEPKYGLIPLIFGTVKATFYSMLFGVPLALLAAIYTSEFMHPRVKRLVKPAVELMASLPSVVLGFLAALVFAPFVEKVLPTALVSFITIPLAFAVGALLWQLLPHRWTLKVQRNRFFFIVACFPFGLGAACLLGPWVEAWFTAGDIMAWLNRQTGSGTIGWVFVFLPVSALGVLVCNAAWINPWIRARAGNWSRSLYAWIEAGRFLLGSFAALGGAIVIGAFLTDLGFDPRGSVLSTYDQRNALIVGFMMGFAIIPIIYTIAEDALSSVPEHLRSASLGCGATPWQTAIYVIIPTAMSGLFSAVMIGLGRAVGETMIVLMAAGNTPVLDLNIFNGFRTLSANIAVELPEAVRNSAHYRTLFLAALTLFIMTFILNTIAEVVRLRFRKRAFEL